MGIEQWPVKKVKLEEKAISEILVADTDSGSGAEASNVEDCFEEEEEQQQQQASAEVAITDIGQQNHQPTCAAVCVLLAAKERAQCIKCTRCDVDLCVVPCFTEYHTEVNL